MTLPVDVIRSKLATINILLLVERDRCAKKAAEIKTGDLANEKARWEHESLLREMIQYDQNAQIIEAILKSLY